MSGDDSAKVGNFNLNQIKSFDAGFGFLKGFQHQKVPTLDDALKFVSEAVKQVIIDAKVGPPHFEKGLAADLLLMINKTRCRNCIIWAKMDSVGIELKKLSDDVMVGYIVMKDRKTGIQSDLLRMGSAEIIGVYHVLVNDKLVAKAHGARKKVYAWTVDDIYSMQRMLFAGVDSIITSQPELLQQVMEDIRNECVNDGFLPH